MQLTKPILSLIEEYISENCNEASTKALYKRTLLLYVDWMIRKDWPVSEPSRPCIISYREYLRARELSLRTIDNYMASVKQFHKWLFDNDHIEKNICLGIKNLRKSSDYIRAALDIDEVKNLLKVAKRPGLIGLRDYAIINLMVRSGLRRVEVCRLNVEDLYEVEGQWYLIAHGKGHSEKDSEIPITENIINPIKLYWIQRGVIGQKGVPAFINHARCSHGRIQPGFLSKMVKRYLIQIGLTDKKYSCHSLRHTTAVAALKAGAKVSQIQQLLRQRSSSTTELYLKAIREERVLDGAAVFAIDEYYSNEPKTGKKQ